MPKTRRPKPVYQRGGFRLDPPRAGRSSYTITWYDPDVGRERSISAGTGDVRDARVALDREYLARTKGEAVCPTCARPFDAVSGFPMLQAVIDYQTTVEAQGRTSAKAIRARLAHIVTYATTRPSVACEDVNEDWIGGFRAWARNRPVVSPAGNVRPRSASTIENSVLQLHAAIEAARRRGDTLKPPQFRPIPPRQVNRTPRYRADVPTIAAMFRYALEPNKKRDQLLAFLRVSMLTLARPDAAHEVSTAPGRGQWMANAHTLDLNPKGRPQTSKYRATVPIARQGVWIFDQAGPVVGVSSVKKAFAAMSAELGLPSEGESGMKLIRRSVANLLRQRKVPAEELELFLGHRRLDSVSDLYAPFDPGYLATAKAAIEAIIDEIESLAPGAFYRDLTARGGNVASIRRAKNG